jgi:tripartite-type tricarboxylate transporter receptor subunit TctC
MGRIIMLVRRSIITIAAAIAAVTLAHAQGYPAKVVKIVSPFVPGGPGDLLPRAIAAGLSPLLGQPVIVENRPGATTIIAMQAVAKAPPDGYTLIFTSVSSFINVSAYKSLPYDPIGDFAPIALCFTTPLYLVAHPSVPANSVAELIALAKSRPGKLSFASGGNGTTAHLAGELFKSLAGVDMQHVPYKSAGPAMMDVMAGHVDLMFGSAGLSEARTGKVRVLAVTSARRSAVAPELPTVQESGLPGFDATLWFGILAPAKTPTAIVARLSGDIGRVLAQAELRERFNTVDVTPSTPEEFADLIRREIPKWRKVFEAAKIQPE